MSDVAAPTVNVLSLCSGIGGLDLGIRMACPSARVVCYVENDAYACEVLASRMEDEALDDAPVWTDLRTFDGRPWRGAVDLVTAGFPCQPFSVAGKREGTEDERWLWEDVARVVREVQPRLVFLENVPGLLVHGGLSTVLRDLDRLRFNAEWARLSAAGSGAPHLRRRIFVLAYAECSGLEEWQGQSRDDGAERTTSERGSGDVANADGRRREEKRGARLFDGERQTHGRQADGCCVSITDTASEGQQGAVQEPHQRWGRLEQSDWWRLEPDVGRVADGIPSRVDRLRCLGNAVVPVVACRAWEELVRRIRA